MPFQKHFLIFIIWMELYCWFISLFLVNWFVNIVNLSRWKEHLVLWPYTHTFHLIAVVNFDWMFCLSCAAWESQKWSWWLDFIGNSVIRIHNLKLLNTNIYKDHKSQNIWLDVWNVQPHVLKIRNNDTRHFKHSTVFWITNYYRNNYLHTYSLHTALK